MLLLAAPVFAQFSEFATTDDGSQLYFTSRMWLKGGQPGVWRESRLYRFGPDGLMLYAERGKLALENVGSSNDGVHYPSVSGDGRVVGLSYDNICGGETCLATTNRIEIRGSHPLAARVLTACHMRLRDGAFP